MIFVLFILLAVFIISGMPVALALGISSIGAIIFGSDVLSLIVLPQRIIATIARSWPLLAIPMFIMLGEIFQYGKIADRLINVANIFFGRIPGALGIINIVASFFFGGISGSASADTAAIGGIMIPAMVKDGYDSKFSTVVTITSSCLGPIVPPSVLTVLIAWVTELPVGAIFLAGYIPGFLLMLFLIIPTYLISIKRNYPRHEVPPFKSAIRVILNAIPALITPIIIVASIVFGLTTIIEASAITVIYSLIVSFFLYKELKVRDIPIILKRTVRMTSSIGLVLAFASGFSWLISYSKLPYILAQQLSAFNLSPILFMIISAIIYLFLGTFINPGAIVLMAMPVLFPAAVSLGINPYHFCMVSALSMVIGNVTPPVGLCLFIGCSISGDKIEEVSITLLPFFLAMLGAVLFIILFPNFVLWLPKLFGY